MPFTLHCHYFQSKKTDTDNKLLTWFACLEEEELGKKRKEVVGKERRVIVMCNGERDKKNDCVGGCLNGNGGD